LANDVHTAYSIELLINGVPKQLTVRGADTLLEVLRHQLGLTGAKPSCLNGDCGCCTVLVDGFPIHACFMLAIEAAGHQITTIEGIKDSPVQKAFLGHSALQCGYCTPGFIMNAHALINSHPSASEDEINDWLSSNLCRCTGYTEIREAIKAALRESGPIT
jgi:carbon-monoxide dehydrogenase small subunit